MGAQSVGCLTPPLLAGITRFRSMMAASLPTLLPPPPHSSLPSALPHTWMVAGITCFLNSVCSSSRLSSTVRRPSPWEEGGQGCQGCRGDQRCAQTLAASPWEGGGQGQCCQE